MNAGKSHGEAQHRSIGTLAAVVCILLGFLTLLGVAILGFVQWRNYVVRQELIALSKAMADLDARYKNPRAPVKLSAVELLKDYDLDARDAENRYRGEMLLVKGVVVGANATNLTLELAGGDSAAGEKLLLRAKMTGDSNDGPATSEEFLADEKEHYQLGNVVRVRGHAGFFWKGELELTQASLVAQ